MGKYEPLGQFLKRQRTDEVSMTFAEIERLLGAKLPPKAQHHRAWWSNNPTNNVMTKVWLAAGFRTEQVDLDARKLVFRRVGAPGSTATTSAAVPQTSPPSERHPLYGALKDLLRVAPGVDLTGPADPEWGEAGAASAS